MCGINGAIGLFSKPDFERALHQLQHRGPDGHGVWQDADNHVLLGHRRLAIIDLSENGAQPMIDDELSITFNGEIYNYKEIKKILEDSGHTFKTHSDTEVILKAFRQWGKDCLDKFNGMWAFAIWNKNTRQLFLSRDRFGVKPLFYAFTNNGFVFGSEMKAITPLLDEVAISDDFNWCFENIYSYESTSKSLIKGIRRFPAGSFAYVTPGNRTIEPVLFWNTLDHLERPENSYEKQVEHFRELFFDSCKIRMRSDVKIGTALSGGLDSSAVAAAMHYMGTHDPESNNTGRPTLWQNAFVATFTGTELDEKEYAEEVVNSLKLKGHFTEIDPVKGIDDLSDYLWHFEELSLTSPIPMIEIYKSIKANGVSVSLDGHGADELFSGYGTMIFNAVRDSGFNLKVIRDVCDTYRHVRGIEKSTYDLMVEGFAGRKNLVQFYLKKLLNQNDKDPLVKKLGYFNSALFIDFHVSILPTLLRNYDRYSMTASVEVRMPFLDYRLVSYCFSLPWQSKLRDGYTKSILRDAISPYLSEKVVRRKLKTGFGTPFTDWLKGPWKEFVMDTITDSSFDNSGIINPKAVRGRIDQFYKMANPGFRDGEKVWEELMPYLWEKSFFKKVAANHEH